MPEPDNADGQGGDVPLCSVERLEKRYGGVHALKGVSLDFHAGRVHAIVGENGAGKSTLMKILAGVERADEGLVKVESEVKTFHSAADANAAGIAIVFQELSLYPDVDVLSNLFARREPRRWGFVRRREMARQAKPLLQRIGLSVDLDARLEQLTLDERQLVEIAKAMLTNPRVLILDEPTSALTARGTDRLLGVIRGLRDQGVAIVFVSHRLEEVFAIADEISVIRDGRHVATEPGAETTMERVVTQMIGRRPTDLPDRPTRSYRADQRLSVRDLSLRRQFSEVSFDVEFGEVVGIAGLEDAGIRPLMRAIFGVFAPDEGTVTLPDAKRRPSSATGAVKAGVAYVPADRRVGGLMLEQSITENVCQVTAGVLREFGPVLSRRAMREATQKQVDSLAIKTSSVNAYAGSLSGGNQQKVVLAKWLAAGPSVFLLDDPTRGVDIGAKMEIYDQVRKLAEQGRAVLFNSSELAEYEYTCHRVLIMRRGRVVGELVGDEIAEDRLLHAINRDVEDTTKV